MSIYPPILLSTLPAFLANTSNYLIYFTLLSITSIEEIGHVLIRVVRLANNKSIVKSTPNNSNDTNYYPDGIIYKTTPQYDSNSLKYYVSIASIDLKEKWSAGVLYKIQVRFGSNSKYSNVKEFASWKKTQVDSNAFSEWSNVMIIKAIDEPEVSIANAEAVKVDTDSQNSESNLTPLFIGEYSSDTETLDKYRFNLYKGDSISSDTEVLDTSEWVQKSSTSGLITYRFKTILTNEETYTVSFEILTVNGYTKSADNYTFIVVLTYLNKLDGVSLIVDDEDTYCSENGCMNLYLTTTSELSGNYIIIRTDEYSNYGDWKDLSYLVYNKQSFNNSLIFQDFTIESGVKYKYAIQLQNSENGLRTSPTKEDGDNERCVHFEYSFLYRNGVLLKLKFNQKLNSFKHTVLMNKLDTLGDKYPHISRNGYAYYAEFPISGLISLLMDDGNTFFSLDDSGYWYNGENILSGDTDIDSNLSNENIYKERRFREKVEEFLNNDDYKLYKSPTEGNIVIVLLNISLTPNSTLGRMIFDFSATAYEVVENTIENLNEYDIINIGSYQKLDGTDVGYSFGLISGLFTSGLELYELIQKQEEISIGGGYKLGIKKLLSIWVENYPILTFKSELLELEAKKSELNNAGESSAEVDAEIAELEELRDIYTSRPQSTSIVLSIRYSNEYKDIVMTPNKIYSLDTSELEGKDNLISEDENNKKLGVYSIQVKPSSNLNGKQPLIINYTCKLVLKTDNSVGVVSAIASSRIWGQISGIFTRTDKILSAYDYQYKNSETYRIYNSQGDNSVIKDGDNILIDNTNINLYKTQNLYEVIKEETKKLIETIYNINGGFTNYDESTDTWDNGTIFYTFGDITSFDIEADPGTILYIGKTGESDKLEVVIGPTGKYVLKPIESLIKYIEFKNPQFAIINYKCLTSLTTKTKQGG